MNSQNQETVKVETFVSANRSVYPVPLLDMEVDAVDHRFDCDCYRCQSWADSFLQWVRIR